MEDHEIATKRLSDWKPETDIKLQKALGKFVEESGELLEESNKLVAGFESYTPIPFENELADCLAFIEVIATVVGFVITEEDLSDYKKLGSENRELLPSTAQRIFSVSSINMWLGRSLAIVGRCQIQGIDKNNPETGKPNQQTLEESLGLLRHYILVHIYMMGLNMARIEKRKQAKIDSKLPWVMGNATDLLPST